MSYHAILKMQLTDHDKEMGIFRYGIFFDDLESAEKGLASILADAEPKTEPAYDQQREHMRAAHWVANNQPQAFDLSEAGRQSEAVGKFAIRAFLAGHQPVYRLLDAWQQFSIALLKARALPTTLTGLFRQMARQADEASEP